MATGVPLLLNRNFTCRVSSVLNRDVKTLGKQHMFDGKEDTCWNSDQGVPQWINLEFQSMVTIDRLEIQFQGGFVGKDLSLDASTGDRKDWKVLMKCYPEDNNTLQSFCLEKPSEPVKFIRILFSSSTDFFGRIIIYKLELMGT